MYRNGEGGPSAFFLQLSEFTQVFGSTIYVAQTLAGDGIVVRDLFFLSHRCADSGWR